ncbi:hypothetical protein ACP70R_039027 [Stipagrostis hirtigluma subsp. patula]
MDANTTRRRRRQGRLNRRMLPPLKWKVLLRAEDRKLLELKMECFRTWFQEYQRKNQQTGEEDRCFGC